MIVELVGAPGAGKSFLAPQIAARCDVRVIKVGRLGQRHFYFALFASRNWQFTSALYHEFRKQEREHPELIPEVKFRRFRSMGAKIAKAQLLGGGLIDEGPFQSILKIFEDVVSRDEIERYIGLINTPPDRIFIVDAPESERLARQRARNNVPRENLGWEKWHSSFVTNLATLKSILLEKFNTEIVVNDGNGEDHVP